MKPGGRVQSCVCNRVCFRTRGIVLFKSCDVEIAQDAGGVYHAGGEEKVDVGRKKGYIYSSSGNFLVQLVRYDNFDSFPAFGWSTNTKRPSLHLVQPQGTSWMTSLKMRFSICGEDSLRCWVMLLHCTPLVPLRPRASRSKLSSSYIVPTVQPSNTASNNASGGKSTCNWGHRIENTSLFSLGCLWLCQRDISTGKLKIYTMIGSKYCAKNECNAITFWPRWYKHSSSGANKPSDIAVTVDMNAEFNRSLIWWQLTP